MTILLQINRLTKKDSGVKSLSLFFMFLMIVCYYVFYDPVAHDTFSKNILQSSDSIIPRSRAERLVKRLL